MRSHPVYNKPQQRVKESPQAVEFPNFDDRLVALVSNSANTQRMFHCAQISHRLGNVDFWNGAAHA